MAAVKTEQEPSIEEILESIRQIISEDGSEEEKAAASPASTAPPKPQPQPAKVMQQPSPRPAKPAENILDLTDKVVPEKEFVAVTAPEAKIELADIQERPPQATPSADDLLSDAAVDAASAAMSKLMSANIIVENPEPGRIGSVTFEDMVRELMRPLIKTWLDHNLPGIIERMVQKEIEKVSRRAMDR